MLITGDVHGTIDTEKLDNLYNRLGVEGSPQFMLIAGDFGSIWRSNYYTPKFTKIKLPTILPTELQNIHAIYDYYPWTTLWIDGNHENFDVLNNLPVEERWGGKVNVITDKCIRLLRGQVFTINGYTFLTMGGAESVDKYRRVRGQSWWPQETISKEDYNEAIRNLAKVNNKVDFVVSHTCPISIFPELEAKLPPYLSDFWGEKRIDPSCRFLEDIRGIIDTKHWYFGHFHINECLEHNGITYHALFDTIVEAPNRKESIPNGTTNPTPSHNNVEPA